MFFFLIAAGLLAGFIDSIAGGGGLITVPVFTLLLGPGATAIGTNKVVAVCSCVVALAVYMRLGHVPLRGYRRFVALAGLGAIAGALCSPLVPPPVYKWFIVLIAPVILWIVFKKDFWVRASLKDDHAHTQNHLLLLAGLLCGFYDGIAGPGGGTLMFLSLFVVARLPLLAAMGTAKIANLVTGSVSLATFASTGHVIWHKGVGVAIGISIGAAIGASLASRSAMPWARAALLVVSSLLIVRLIFS